MKHQSGFTLIEIMVAVAIAGLLLVIALAGTAQLQQRARFDASIDQLIQDISYARNYATSEVNSVGNGNSSLGVLAGAGFELDNLHPIPQYSLAEVETLYGLDDASGNLDVSTIGGVFPPNSITTDNALCPPSHHPLDNDECQEEFLPLSDPDLRVTQFNGVNDIHFAIYFVTKTPGDVVVCHDAAIPNWVSPQTACANYGFDTKPLTFEVSDTEGYSATLSVDPATGVATRQ